MKGKHLLMLFAGYEVVAFLFNRYNTTTSFAFPLDLISYVVPKSS